MTDWSLCMTGASNALAVAEGLGFSPDVIREARVVVSQSQVMIRLR